MTMLVTHAAVIRCDSQVDFNECREWCDTHGWPLGVGIYGTRVDAAATKTITITPTGRTFRLHQGRWELV